MPTRCERLAPSIKLTWPFEQGCDRGQTSKTSCSLTEAPALTHIRLPSKTIATCTAGLDASHIAKHSMVGLVVDFDQREAGHCSHCSGYPCEPLCVCSHRRILFISTLRDLVKTRHQSIARPFHCCPCVDRCTDVLPCGELRFLNDNTIVMRTVNTFEHHRWYIDDCPLEPLQTNRLPPPLFIGTHGRNATLRYPSTLVLH